MEFEKTRFVRNGVQAFMALLTGLGLKHLGVDLTVVFEWAGVDAGQVENFVYLLVLPAVSWFVGVLERNVHPLFGVLNGPRKQIEYKQIEYKPSSF